MTRKSKEELINTAIKYYNTGCYMEAIKECEKALALDRKYVRAYHGIARSLINMKEYKIALKYISEALKLKETSALYTQRGDIHYELKDYVSASNDYYRAIALDANNKEAIEKKAKANEQVNRRTPRGSSGEDEMGFRYIPSNYKEDDQAGEYYEYVQDWDTYIRQHN